MAFWLLRYYLGRTQQFQQSHGTILVAMTPQLFILFVRWLHQKQKGTIQAQSYGIHVWDTSHSTCTYIVRLTFQMGHFYRICEFWNDLHYVVIHLYVSGGMWNQKIICGIEICEIIPGLARILGSISSLSVCCNKSYTSSEALFIASILLLLYFLLL